MLFDLTHILYMVISAIISVALLIVIAKFVKKEQHKECFLKWTSVITIIIHYSSIWVTFFGNAGSTEGLEDSHLFPIYPCHIMMWVLLIAAFIKNKKGKLFKTLAEFCFWVGIICGSIGIILNENYGNTPSLQDWDILKGLLSHSTLLIGCIYMLVGKFIKIDVSNVLSVVIGLLFFIIDGYVAILLYDVCGLGEINAMYLRESPISSMPWLSPFIMGAVGVSLLFACLALYELSFPKEERWYKKLKNKIEDIKNNKRKKV